MNAEELKMAISPVVLRDEVTRLQAKEQLWYQDVEEREELAKLQLETLDALGAEIKRLRMAYTAHDDALKDALADALCWMQLAAKLAGDLKAVLSCRPVDRIGCAEDLAAYDAMVKGKIDGR